MSGEFCVNFYSVYFYPAVLNFVSDFIGYCIFSILEPNVVFIYPLEIALILFSSKSHLCFLRLLGNPKPHSKVYECYYSLHELMCG